VALARIAARDGGQSEATPAVADAMAADAAPWPDAIDIDTTASLPDTIDRAVLAWSGDTAPVR
jgi:uncharacterized protein